jgi:acyl-CoA synthetase (AMP-forming)/AMP-acid ligase II
LAFSILDQIKQRAAENPTAPALIGLSGCITYGELVDGITKDANHFADRRLPHLGKALLNIAHPDYRLVIFLAAMEYGLIPMIAQASTLRGNFDWDLAIATPEPISPDVPPDLLIDQDVFTGRFADGRPRTFGQRGDGDLAYVAETSGTTGRPKLVALTYEQFRKRVHIHRFSAADRVLYSMGAATTTGIGNDTRALAVGAAVVHPSLDVAVSLRLINLYNVNYVGTTPAFIERALDLMELKNIQCRSVRSIRLTGATFTRDLLARIEGRFKGVEIKVGYGASEVRGGIASGVVSSATYRKGYVGNIREGLTVVCTGTPTNPGGIAVANDRDRFSRAILKGQVIKYDQPFYNLPDIGHLEGSTLYLAGRSDEVLNYGGNIKSYSLIAEEIGRLASVKEVAIVSGASLGHDRDLVIGVVADRPLDLDDLAGRLAERLRFGDDARRHFKFFQTSQIRHNPQTGKLDRVGHLQDYQNRIRQAAPVTA